jgi:hypothetical protein
MAAMKRPVWIIAGIVVLGGLVLWLVLRPRAENVVVNFVDDFSAAVERRPTPDTFTTSDVTLAGVTKRSIVAKNPSRIAWSVTIPENARLVLSAGIQEEGWTTAGDGVSFRASLNDDEVLNLLVDPYGDASARRWHEVEVDLSEFAGETMNVFLKTFTGRTATGDLPVWGEPRIITR